MSREGWSGSGGGDEMKEDSRDRDSTLHILYDIHTNEAHKAALRPLYLKTKLKIAHHVVIRTRYETDKPC